MGELIVKIGKIPSKISHEVLKTFVQACQQLHRIAFYQWRLKFSDSKYLLKDQIIENIEEKMAMIYRKIKVTKITKYPPKECEVTNGFLDKFRHVIQPPQTFHIASFKQIGFHDPFPNEQMEGNFLVP